MNRLKEIAVQLDVFFNRVLKEDMIGLPLLNTHIEVETVCFQIYDERPMGVIICPWLMSLVIFPKEGDDWSGLKIGDRQDHEFPSGDQKFLVNEYEGIGVCQSMAIHSPMVDFKSHEHARLTAHVFMKKLMTPVDPEDRLDEKRLERFVDGEEMAEIHHSEKEAGKVEAAGKRQPDCDNPPEIARRDFIRGKFKKDKGRVS
ncbi:MAG: [NiFe]-hydrogenase assembly chaperone HybE [bacterium]|nr:[NiFe]-hydrogenase assembly chaperone HybE [bacterium]